MKDTSGPSGAAWPLDGINIYSYISISPLMDLSIDPEMRPFLGSAPPGLSPAMRSLLMSLGGSDFISFPFSLL